MSKIIDEGRLAAVGRSGLVDSAREAVFDELTRAAAKLLGAPFAFLTVVDERQSFWMSTFGIEDGSRGNSVEDSFCQYVVESGTDLIVDDATVDPITKHNPSIESMGVRAWAGCPVVLDGEVLGTFCVVDTETRRWSGADRAALRSMARLASREIELRADLRATRSELGVAERELERDRTLLDVLRVSLLPPLLPTIPRCDIATRYEPAAGGDTMLGDFYDAFPLGVNRWGVVLGDVCGHGVQAARLTALVRYSLRAAAVHHADPSAVLAELNESVLRDTSDEGRFATLCYLDIDTSDGVSIEVLRAGHPFPVLFDPTGDARFVATESAGPPVGIVAGAEFTASRVELEPGQTLLLFSDGVTECRDRFDHEVLGEDRLLLIIEDRAAIEGEVLDHIVREVHDFGGHPSDDIVLLRLTRSE